MRRINMAQLLVVLACLLCPSNPFTFLFAPPSRSNRVRVGVKLTKSGSPTRLVPFRERGVIISAIPASSSTALFSEDIGGDNKPVGNPNSDFISFSDATAAIQQEEEEAKMKERGGGEKERKKHATSCGYFVCLYFNTVPSLRFAFLVRFTSCSSSSLLFLPSSYS